MGTLEFLVLKNQAPFPISGQFWVATVAPAYKSFSVLLSVCIDPFICTFSDRHTYIIYIYILCIIYIYIYYALYIYILCIYLHLPRYAEFQSAEG